MSEKEWNEDHPCWWENHDWEFDGDYNNWLWDGDKELWTFTATCADVVLPSLRNQRAWR